MSEAREKKAQIVAELTELFTECKVGILTDYRGLSVAEAIDLRGKLREVGVKYRVVKNTLARLAADAAARPDVAGLFDGPVAIAFGYDDMTVPAKALVDYIRSSQSSLSVRAGFLADRLLTVGEVNTLATLPSREVLVAKVLGTMQSPIVRLLSCLESPLRGLVGVLEARSKQLEGDK
ncbi:50S ribosomal protein L10 [Chloroflexota bacterium]